MNRRGFFKALVGLAAIACTDPLSLFRKQEAETVWNGEVGQIEMIRFLDQPLEPIIERGKQMMQDASGWGTGKGDLITFRRYSKGFTL